MGDLVARTGRHQQLYEDGYRLVAGCIPYRYKRVDDTCNGNAKQRFEVLMITSQSGPGLLFPKGGWENDETVEQAACREALEEAGVRGDIKGRLGSWEFRSKSHRDEYSHGYCRAEMFAMCVTEQLDSWPEQDARQRQWLEIAEALDQCRYDWMREALNVCVSTYSALPSSNSDVPVSRNHSELTDAEQS